jgi:hypothetical protein
MPWPHVVEPAAIAEARWLFTERDRWRPERLEPATVDAIRVLLSSREYWDLHASVTGFWSERYNSAGSVYRT